MRTLNAGTHEIVMTRGINDEIADDAEFAKFVWKSLLRFNRADWGDVGKEDWKANDADLESLNNGGWYGRILASYTFWVETKIWIIRNTAKEDGTQVITVLFPEEY
jgi:hypothetical protein